MKQVRVLDREGRAWVVRRRWLPWGVQWRGPRPARRKKAPDSEVSGPGFLDFGDLLLVFDSSPSAFLTFVAILVVVVIVVLFIVPLFIFVVELLIVAIVVAAAVVFRVLFRRPWLVDALPVETGVEEHLIWKVVGFRRSGVAVDQIADQLRWGVSVPSVAEAILVRGPSGPLTPERTAHYPD